MNTIWILLLDWFNEYGEETRECEYCFFTDVEQALDKAYKLCHSTKAWEKAGKPYNLSLHRRKEGESMPEGGTTYMAAWFQLDKKIRDTKF